MQAEGCQRRVIKADLIDAMRVRMAEKTSLGWLEDIVGQIEAVTPTAASEEL